MSRKHHELEVAAGGGGVGSADDASGKAEWWDTGSSLYDSYELAAVRRLLDRRLLAAAGALALREGATPAAGETRGKSTSAHALRASRVHRRKVTLRALFRAVATWVARPMQAPPLACACAGMVHDQSGAGAAVEPGLPSRGQL